MFESAPAAPSTRHHAALALVAASALLLEVTLVRLLSVSLWYPVAYVTLSTAMLGFGAAAVAVTLSRRLAGLAAGLALQGSSIALAAAIAVGYPAWNALPVDPLSLLREPLQLVWVPLLLVLVAIPFAAAGFFIATVFGHFPAAGPRLYAADLAGAALGTLAYVVVLPEVGGPGTLLVAAALAMTAALVLHEGALHLRLLLAGAVAALLTAAPHLERALPLRITDNKLLGTPFAQSLPRGSLWSLSSAIDVIPGEAGPLIVIDGGTAMTQAPRRSGRDSEPPTGLRALAYALGPGKSTLVVGSGGGVEVQAALGAGATRVLALEIDPAINSLVRGRLSPMLGGLFHDPRVELVTAEARAYLAASTERFDAIVAFHTISNAASATGAMSLAENYLQTTEALRLLFDRLSDDGVLVMSRPEAQAGRLVATAAAAWPFDEALSAHLAVVTQTRETPDFLTAIVIRRRPFDEASLAHLRRLTPGRIGYEPTGGGDSQAFFAAALTPPSPEQRAAARREAELLPYRPATLVPTTDDRPFFNMNQPWSALGAADVLGFFGAGRAGRARLEDLPVAQISILILLLEALALAALFVWPPARALARRGVAARDAARVAVYFGALGLGFMLLEVVLIQRLVRIVGDPAWSLVAVLASLLAATGAGSLVLAGRLRLTPARACVGAIAAALFVAAPVAWIASLAEALPFAMRISVVVACVLPVGFFLGGPFAAGLSRLDREDLVAWAWALNSLASVGGSLGALIIGSSVGFAATAFTAAAVYALALLTARRHDAWQA